MKHTTTRFLATLGLGILGVLLAALPTAAQTSAQTEDITGPTISEFSLDKRIIDTTNGAVDVTLTATFEDDLSGVAEAEVRFALSPWQYESVAFVFDGSSNTATMTFPKDTRTGTWFFQYAFATDEVGNRTMFGAADLNNVTVGVPTIEVTGQPVADDYLPVATAISINKPNIDITNNAVTARLSATFEVTPLTEWVGVTFESPSGGSRVRFSFPADEFNRLPASATATFPQFLEPGVWTVRSVAFSEGYFGSSVIYSADTASALTDDLLADDLLADHKLGFDNEVVPGPELAPEASSPPRYFPLSDLNITLPTITVTGQDVDTTAPKVTGLTLDTSTVNITNAAVPVTLSLDVSDDLSGVDSARVSFAHRADEGQVFSDTPQVIFEFDGSTTSATANVPRHARTGTWEVASIHVKDRVGNEDRFVLTTLNNTLVPVPTIEVVGTQDITPPQLTTLSVSPSSISTADNAVDVAVEASFTDDVSGFKAARIRFDGPDTAQTVTVDFDGNGTGMATFPRYADAGTWTIGLVVMVDHAGNLVNYGTGAGELDGLQYWNFQAQPLRSLGISLPSIENAGVGSSIPGKCGGKLITVRLADGDQPTYGDDVILGTPGDDVIRAGWGSDTICAGGGKDIVLGEEGDDTIYGGDGVDQLIGGAGDDTIHGEGGSDRILAGDGNDVVFAGSGADRVKGGDGDDELFGMGGRDRLDGGDGNDLIQGNQQSDWIWGGSGADTLRGAGGKDLIWGGTDHDFLYGGDNSDTLRGGFGNDHLDGQRGRDTCNGDTGNNTMVRC